MISQIFDSSSDTEEILNSDSDEENKLLYLTKMGYLDAEASIAMERCGLDSSIVELTYFICVAQMAKKQGKLEKKLLNEDDHVVHLSIPMIGSGVPTEPDQITQRTLPEYAIGPLYFYYKQIHLSNLMIGFGVHTKPNQITQRTLPEDAIRSSYFYYENVALAPVNVWTGISQYLFDVEPEFVDSKHFHDATLKRGYIHNLPIENRFPLILFSSRTIHDIFPLTKWWPSWDPRTRNKVTPLESDEVEMLLEVSFYCLSISLKIDVQELNDDRLEQLLSRFRNFDLVIGHNGYHLDKENDQHRRNSNDVSRLEPASRYNQSAGSDLFMAL
ncbi:hypothetical protein F3Y22_tig00000136pilonHSYRG00049 [Hibiscus syriacus]|uniref:SAM-dependent MTase DRM-type domain-containing protein n=1 Tax=Hibiscus syriacus TaxID=106335 RepID=A0A6A3D2Y8_HIBSY|nr:hypothetical protein F3Y22_tig00000136pilonHSYRG00049 [Hibiscus syriacus]